MGFVTSDYHPSVNAGNDEAQYPNWAKAHVPGNASTLCCMGGNGTPRRRALGAALREAREAAGYTNLTAFAQLIEVAPATLSRWETGERTPKPTDVVRILTTLGVNGQQFEDILALASDTDAPY